MASFRRRTPVINNRPSPLASKSSAPNIKNATISKPSLLSTTATVISTGLTSLDKFLQHGGLPLNSIILIKESGSTDYSSRIVKSFVAQGVCQSKSIQSTHTIVVGMDPHWCSELPQVYVSSKDKKKLNVANNESKLSVGNLSHSSQVQNQHQHAHEHSHSHTPNQGPMKIAWRYGLNNKQQGTSSLSGTMPENDKEYCQVFDITKKMEPMANLNDVSTVEISQWSEMTKKIEFILKRFPTKNVRIVMPYFLNPFFYPLLNEGNQAEIFKFLLNLKRITLSYKDQVSLMITINSQLYANLPILDYLQDLSDSVIEIEPHPSELSELLERCYKSDPTRVSHGWINLEKLAGVSEYGCMVGGNKEWSFRNGRRDLAIEEWGIPVDGSEVQEENNKASLEF